MRRMSVREANRRKLREVAERVVGEGWEVVLLSELREDGEGVVWLGEGEREVVLVHGRKAGIMLWGAALGLWVEEGQQKWLGERVVAVVLGGLRLVSVYQPSWGADREGMERCRRDMGSQVAAGGRESLVMGGDFNANVGANVVREGVSGRFGTGRMNEAGRDLLEWCEENGMAYVNSYERYARRGTWRHMANGRWYELDAFLVRKGERHRMVKKVWTREAYGLLDHRPVCMKIKSKCRRWRREMRQERQVKIKWEVMKGEQKRREYEEKTREMMEERNIEIGECEWGEVANILVDSAMEVCGRETKELANPWTVGREREIEELKEKIKQKVESRERHRDVINARRRLRVRAGREGDMGALLEEYERLKGEVKEARKCMKRFLRRIENEWWQEIIRECNEACGSGRIGDMYKCLRKIGTRKSRPERVRQ